MKLYMFNGTTKTRVVCAINLVLLKMLFFCFPMLQSPSGEYVYSFRFLKQIQIHYTMRMIDTTLSQMNAAPS